MSKFFSNIKNYFKTKVIPIFTNIEWLEIPVSTYVRWILTFVLSINTLFTYLGWNPIPFSEHAIYELVSLILNIAVLIVNTYKNNSTSKEALIADKIMRALKAAATSDEETAIGKLNDILEELNGEGYISAEHTNSESITVNPNGDPTDYID